MKRSRILQISNDISESDCTATAKELIEVVKYFRNKVDQWQEFHNMVIGDLLLHHLKATKQRHPKGK